MKEYPNINEVARYLIEDCNVELVMMQQAIKESYHLLHFLIAKVFSDREKASRSQEIS